MRKIIFVAASAVAVLGFSVPAMAQDWQGRHDWQHDRLDQRHDDVHDQLDEEHDEAHEQGLSPWGHAQLHRDLQYQHEDADYRMQLQHRREHQREEWRRRHRAYGNYGYRPYGY
ncbi:hypothetical protein BH10PSE14_BH10PSE14_20480 [soil metagenome]|uniref:hypothetical protein n=1 Tax=Sphingomonas sp. AR_OL41 TaxID=3042729 RepID=UPI0024813D3D|nr:hypothetical protein [Sphingomonas sp. AR_OL41]MDH7972564.1 hypothetical protein [Sphingomonas sp. AR_OL41]